MPAGTRPHRRHAPHPARVRPQTHARLGVHARHRIERRRTPLLDGAAYDTWRQLVEPGFSGVGGSLQASLRRAHGRRRVIEAFRAARLDDRALVGEVPPGAWLNLHEVLAGRAS